jgi:signal transduction histidine kinase
MPSKPAGLHLRWPLLVLMASIGLTAFAAFDAQRTVRGQNKVVARAIREFSSFAAWSYSEHLKQQITASSAEVLGAVNHGDNLHTNLRLPPANDLPHYLPEDPSCDCHRARNGPNPAAFFGFKLGTRNVDVAKNYYAGPGEGWLGDPQPGVMVDPSRQTPSSDLEWLADTLTVEIHRGVMTGHRFGFVIANHANRIRPLAYTLMPTSWGDTMVYAAEYTPVAFSEILQNVLNGDGLLPATFTEGKRNRDVVAVRVSDNAGHNVYESVPGVRSAAFTELVLPEWFGAIALHVMVRPDQAAGLIIGGTPISRLPFLLGLLALAATLSVVAVAQIRRETELAGLRADFVSSISHELRTPLAQIKLYLETIRAGRTKTAEQRDWSLAHIDRETTRLGNLVENVLRFARLGRAEEPSRVAISLANEVERIVDEFRPLAASRKAEIVVDVKSDAHVAIKPEALRHAVVNLLDNAVKYGPTGQTIRVDVALRSGKATVTVIDEGSGVPQAEREAIWQPFRRAKTATDAAGSGIGLAIVKDVLGQNAGTAWVEDAPEGGARFVIALPVATAIREERKIESQEAVAAGGAR